VGVFFGISEYEFSPALEQLTGGMHSLNLSTPAADARSMDEAMRKVGRLTQTRVFANEQATKANLQNAITTWLPSITRPGDTVFIYCSGHGGQVPDDNGDEADGTDEFLVPYDFINLDIVVALMKLDEAGKLDPASKRRLVEAAALARGAGSDSEYGARLKRKYGVTDDLFGHWLQRLAGRQVIVILDICFSGGFANNEKSLDRPAAPKGFDFLEGEVGRLKDIGQRDGALLAASGTAQTASVRLESDLSVLTRYLFDRINAAPGSLTLEQAHQLCAGDMANYFDEWNQKLTAAGKEPLTAHQPVLVNYCTQPALLKP
jgi:hypothetical protein